MTTKSTTPRKRKPATESSTLAPVETVEPIEPIETVVVSPAEPRIADAASAQPQFAQPEAAQPQTVQLQYMQPQYQQPQYAQPQPPYAGQPTTYGTVPVAQPHNGYAIASLVLSISSLVLALGIPAVLGIVFGYVARKQPLQPSDRALTTWGIALGFVSLFGWVVLVIVGLIVLLPVMIAHGAFTG